MKTFTDTANRSWSLSINIASIKRVRDNLDNVDLLAINDGQLLERLLGDPVLLVDVIYVLCKPQADEAGVSDEAFGEAMAGDVIEHATTALLDELVSFFPNPRDRANLGEMIQTRQRVADMARKIIHEKLISGEIENEARKILQNSVGDISGSLLASSGSTHPP